MRGEERSDEGKKEKRTERLKERGGKDLSLTE